MTFYWWSHWFWITLVSNMLLFITIVHTYPSQEISIEYNQNSRIMKTGVTKLYQTTTTTLSWATAAPADGNQVIGVTAERTILQSVTPDMKASKGDDDEDANELPAEALEESDNFEEDQAFTEDQLEQREARGDDSASEEFKRSAESYNKTDESVEQADGSSTANAADEESASQGEPATIAKLEPVKVQRDETEVNNYTNFSSAAGGLSASESNTNNSSNNATSTPAVTADAANSADAAAPALEQPAAAAAPAAPKIDGAKTALEWFNAMAAMTSTSTSSTDAKGLAVAEGSVPQSQRVPFTLENANKEEELRRAENEHRTRKSKVLSAEYKHINRFINLSTDSKNLLTRSASTAPEYDAEEGNISSEALAIQRTYFLDAGAISAICFSIFGMCCAVGTVGIVLYRRRYLNKPQALSEPDSSVYIDDSTMRVSDNSDEMYSLDNDSFLNSLEAMTIQNYWTDTVKHTKL